MTDVRLMPSLEACIHLVSMSVSAALPAPNLITLVKQLSGTGTMLCAQCASARHIACLGQSHYAAVSMASPKEDGQCQHGQHLYWAAVKRLHAGQVRISRMSRPVRDVAERLHWMIPVPGELPNAALLSEASAEFRGLGPGESRTERAKGFLSCRSAQHAAALLVAVKKMQLLLQYKDMVQHKAAVLVAFNGCNCLISPGTCR